MFFKGRKPQRLRPVVSDCRPCGSRGSEYVAVMSERQGFDLLLTHEGNQRDRRDGKEVNIDELEQIYTTIN